MALIETYSLGEIEAELEREIKMRAAVYPRQIELKRKSRDAAERQTNLIRCALAIVRGRIFVHGKGALVSAGAAQAFADHDAQGR